MNAITTTRSFGHVTERHARRLLVSGDPPSHAALDLAYQAARAAVEADETNPAVDWRVIDARWNQLIGLSPGCTIQQRMTALRGFYSV